MEKEGYSFAFKAGVYAGFVALAFSFFLRLGGIAPFAPETGIEAFISLAPAWITEPMVQSFGDTAGLLGLIIASIIALVVYGVFGVVYEKFYSRFIRKFSKISYLEGFLSFSVVVFLFFGLIVFPLAGGGTFGLTTTLYAPYAVLVFPLALLISQLLFGFVLMASFRRANPSKEALPVSPARRAFIERAGIFGIAAVLGLTSLGVMVSSAIATLGSSGRPGSSYNLSQAPQIFDDPRLATLVNSEITANSAFYRVAIDLFDPNVNGNSWKLQVDGGNTSKSYSLQDLKNLAPLSQYSTFECVSNLVNGNLISNAKWTGVKISDLLSDAGVTLANAVYVVFYSVDGYSVGLPVATAARSDSLLAYQMNDQDLPAAHGYPLRAVIPGLYGMMSAKWITRISVVDSSYTGYWQSRGWTQNATVNTLAFIIVPGDGSSFSKSQNNSILLGGYAFAGDRGISKVELSFDQGNTWQEAVLKDPISNLTWRLWAYSWNPPARRNYTVYARATDGQDQVQTVSEASNFPNGATGYAMISINVT